MRRSELREHIFKLLFLAEFNTEEEMPEQLALYFDSFEELSDADREYMESKYAHVREHLDDIDEILYEMKYDEDVPVGVAINEAVEIAKRFGGDTSGSFVNGILGKAARLPEKSKEPENKEEPKESDNKEEPEETEDNRQPEDKRAEQHAEQQ